LGIGIGIVGSASFGGKPLEVATLDAMVASWPIALIGDIAAAHGAADRFLAHTDGTGCLEDVDFGIEPCARGAEKPVDQRSPSSRRLMGAVLA